CLMGCQTAAPGGSVGTPEEKEQADVQATRKMLDGLRQGDASLIVQSLDETLTGQLSEEQLLAAWSAQAETLGAFQQAGEEMVSSQDGQVTVSIPCQHEKGSQNFVCTFNDGGKLIGIWLRNVDAPIANNNWEIPDGVTETDVVLGQGTALELKGKLTMPMGDGPFPGVVLVHGSGSTDMDETIGSNKPFRDLAYGLSERGIAVLRYDKSAYAHPEVFTGVAFTVDDEYTTTVKEAMAYLKGNTQVGNIYLLGHSQGGMLAPYLMAECGGFAGGIILAGTPRTLWDLIYRQNLAAIGTLSESQQKTYLAQIEGEKARAEALDRGEMTEAERKTATIFGIPAGYLYHMDQIDAVALIKESGLPFMILQGDKDFQVDATVDFQAWQSGLGAENPDVSYRLYEGLNHLFMESKGEKQGTVAEYDAPGHIPKMVLDDIAAWVQTQE
ncbi:MAG: alpha/beta fold hydrolase, partial [Oscillospiraceae bacterium]|nr:alpha/beta fold hydrolase [Oscillospiraceae bacterium]